MAHATADWRPPFVGSIGESLPRYRAGLGDGAAASIAGPKTCETALAASARRYPPVHRPRGHAIQTTSGGERSRTRDRRSLGPVACAFAGRPPVGVGERHFDSNGLVTARQEPNESEDRQEKTWHAPIVPLHTVLSQSFTRGRNNGEGQPAERFLLV